MNKRFIIRNQQIENRCFEALRGLHKSEKLMEVVIKEYKSSRSLEQNALMWKWFTEIGNELGYTKQEVHDHCVDIFGHVSIDESFGQVRYRKRGTSTYNVKEMTDFLNDVHVWASAEFGIALTTPLQHGYEWNL